MNTLNRGFMNCSGSSLSINSNSSYLNNSINKRNSQTGNLIFSNSGQLNNNLMDLNASSTSNAYFNNGLSSNFSSIYGSDLSINSNCLISNDFKSDDNQTKPLVPIRRNASKNSLAHNQPIANSSDNQYQQYQQQNYENFRMNYQNFETPILPPRK